METSQENYLLCSVRKLLHAQRGLKPLTCVLFTFLMGKLKWTEISIVILHFLPCHGQTEDLGVIELQ